MRRSTLPFPQAFRGLREDLDMTERQVTKAALAHGGQTFSVMNRVYIGKTAVLPHHMRAVAPVLGVTPEYFAEYRLFQVIGLFDINGDGRRGLEPLPFDRAMHNLDRFEDLMQMARSQQSDESAHDPATVAAGLEGEGAPVREASDERS